MVCITGHGSRVRRVVCIKRLRLVSIEESPIGLLQCTCTGNEPIPPMNTEMSILLTSMSVGAPFVLRPVILIIFHHFRTDLYLLKHADIDRGHVLERLRSTLCGPGTYPNISGLHSQRRCVTHSTAATTSEPFRWVAGSTDDVRFR